MSSVFNCHIILNYTTFSFLNCYIHFCSYKDLIDREFAFLNILIKIRENQAPNKGNLKSRGRGD